MIVAVESSCLVVNYLFQLKEMLQICIAEEGNPHQIKLKTVRRDHMNLIVAGSNCYVYATYLLQSGWVVRNACYREGEDTRKIPSHLKCIDDKAL